MKSSAVLSSAMASKRYLWGFALIIAALPGGAALLVAATGAGLWAAAPLLLYFGLIPLLDAWLGEDPFNPSEDDLEALISDRYFEAILYAAIVVFWISFLITVSITVSKFSDGAIGVFAYVALAFSAGVASGGALTVGHELGHRPDKRSRLAATAINLLTGYAHFRIEHNHGHHRAVATPEDSASARFGESVWAFACREIPGGVVRAWSFEARRLKALGKSPLSLDNEIIRGWLISGAIIVALVALLGFIVLPFLVIHHLTGWLQLTFANYVEHYGLTRRLLASGKYEPCAPHHSWNSNHIVSNLALFHLQRHSDHHANPMRPYQALRSFDHLPTLPSGYPGCFLLAAVPPLWRRVMDPRVLDWSRRESDLVGA